MKAASRGKPEFGGREYQKVGAKRTKGKADRCHSVAAFNQEKRNAKRLRSVEGDATREKKSGVRKYKHHPL